MGAHEAWKEWNIQGESPLLHGFNENKAYHSLLVTGYFVSFLLVSSYEDRPQSSLIPRPVLALNWTYEIFYREFRCMSTHR